MGGQVPAADPAPGTGLPPPVRSLENALVIAGGSQELADTIQETSFVMAGDPDTTVLFGLDTVAFRRINGLN
jgi:hypothetical protein